MDLVNVIESAYADSPTLQDWLDGVLAASLPLLDRGFGVVGYTVDARDLGAITTANHCHRGDRPEVREGLLLAESVFAGSGPDDPRRTLHTRPVSTMSMHVDAARTFGLDDSVDALRGARDMIGVVAADPTGCGVSTGALLPEVTTPTSADVRRWSRVAAHLAAGFRLRRSAPGDGEAVLEPAGKIAHAVGDAKAAPAREALARAAIAVDRARGRVRRENNDDAVEVWRGLVAGRWSLVERFESDGRRYLIARQNDPKVDALPMLTERERQVLIFRALGHSLKLIAYELGLSKATVSRTFSRAKAKLGIRSPADLMALLAAPRAS